MVGKSAYRDGSERRLSVNSQKMMEDMKRRADEAGETIASAVDGESPENDDRAVSWTPRQQSHFQVMPTIKEEIHSISIRSNSVRIRVATKLAKSDRHLDGGSAAVFKTDDAVADRDAVEVRRYLQQIYLLRYNHAPFEAVGSNVETLAAYLKWRATRERDVGSALASSLGLHPVELDRVLQPRLDNMLHRLGIDSAYVKARLTELDNIYFWVYGYKRMAHNAEWPKLAKQFLDDRTQFDKIFPGAMTYPNPERRIYESNTKAKVYVGMVQLRGQYFARIDGPENFKLSKVAKRMNRRLLRELSSSQERQTSKPGTFTRFKDWVKRKRDALVLRYKEKNYI